MEYGTTSDCEGSKEKSDLSTRPRRGAAVRACQAVAQLAELLRPPGVITVLHNIHDYVLVIRMIGCIYLFYCAKITHDYNAQI